jgi:hypothetical protein
LLEGYAGPRSIIFRDFLRDHIDRFEKFVRLNAPINISLGYILSQCEGPAKTSPVSTAVPIQIIQLMLLDDESYLRSETNFVVEKDIAELESLYRRAQRLPKFEPQCIEPRKDKAKQQARWKSQVAEFRVTSALFGLAAAGRMARIADSTDERRRAKVIRDESNHLLRDAYSDLESARNEDRRAFEALSLSESLFKTSAWEASYRSARQMIDQLNATEP